jgi:hypothetical protein
MLLSAIIQYQCIACVVLHIVFIVDTSWRRVACDNKEELENPHGGKCKKGKRANKGKGGKRCTRSNEGKTDQNARRASMMRRAGRARYTRRAREAREAQEASRSILTGSARRARMMRRAGRVIRARRARQTRRGRRTHATLHIYTIYIYMPSIFCFYCSQWFC